MLGRWCGEGQGKFPTIDPFRYRETHTFSLQSDHPFLSYVQDTVLLDRHGEPLGPGHFEVGLIKPQDDGSLIMSNAQDSTRVEVLKGVITEVDGELQICFRSQLHGHDPRMVSSDRDYRFRGDTFHYTVDMATTRMPLQRHLEATLKRG